MPYSNLQPAVVHADNLRFPPRRFSSLADAVNDPQAVQRQLDGSDDEPSIDWTEEDVVRLHCLLLDDLSALADPATPLEEKFDTLRWIFTDPDKDDKPFSFASCVRVAGCSPLSTFRYFGRIQADDFRELLQGYVRRWLRETLDRYPSWVSDAIAHNPQWSADRLAKNPQWINEQIKRQTVQGDLFA